MEIYRNFEFQIEFCNKYKLSNVCEYSSIRIITIKIPKAFGTI